MKILDFKKDVLEASNLARLPFTPEQVGMPKVYALAELIASIRDIDVIPYAQPFQTIKDNEVFIAVVSNVDMVVDAVDRVSISNMIVQFAKKHLPDAIYLNPNYDGYSFSIVVSKARNMEESFILGDDRGGYTIAPSFVGSALFPSLLSLFVVSVLKKDNAYVHKNMLEIVRKVLGDGGD